MPVHLPDSLRLMSNEHPAITHGCVVWPAPLWRRLLLAIGDMSRELHMSINNPDKQSPQTRATAPATGCGWPRVIRECR
jgi:hypothetical protein